MKNKRHISELGLRILSAAAVIPIVLSLTVMGSIWFQLLVLVLAALLALELVNNVGDERVDIIRILTILLFLGTGTLAIFGEVVAALMAGGGGAVILAGVSGLRSVKAVIYLAGMILGSSAVAGLIALRSDIEFGLIAILWLFAVVWSADTMAYFSGRLIGGPKLAPKVSPNKTWAGFLGGIAGAAVAGLVLTRLVEVGSEIILVGLSAAAAVVAQAGDLLESWAKRQLGVKDSGRLLPGHGGVWDRLDALILVVIFAAVIGIVRGNDQSLAYNLLIW